MSTIPSTKNKDTITESERYYWTVWIVNASIDSRDASKSTHSQIFKNVESALPYLGESVTGGQSKHIQANCLL